MSGGFASIRLGCCESVGGHMILLIITNVSNDNDVK